MSKDQRYALVAAGLGLAGALFMELPGLLDPARATPDLFQHLPGILAAAPGSPLRGDLLASFSASVQPLGFAVLYQIAGVWLDPLLFSRFLPFLLVPLASFLFYRLARRFLEPNGALAATAIFLILPSHMMRFHGGLHRAFAYPLTIFFTLAALSRRWAGILAALLGSALFYPPALVWMAATFPILLLVKNDAGPRKTGLSLLAWGAGIFAGGALLWWNYFSGAGMGDSLFTRAEILKMAEFGEGGRLEYSAVPDLLGYLVHKFSNFEIAALGTLFVLGGWRVLGRHPRLFSLLAGGLLASAISWAAYPLLYVPTRYASLSLDLFSPLILAVMITSLLASPASPGAAAASRQPQVVLAWTLPFGISLMGSRPDTWARIEPGAIGGLVFLALASSLLIWRARLRHLLVWPLIAGSALAWSAYAYYPSRDLKAPMDIMAEISRLPPRSIIAGPARTVDPVPVYTRHPIYLGYELAYPLYRDYYAQVKERALHFYRAYYAASLSDVAAFCKRSGVGAIVVDPGDFAEAALDSGPDFYEPVASEIRAFIGDRRMFALPEFASELPGGPPSRLRLITCEQILKENSSLSRIAFHQTFPAD